MISLEWAMMEHRRLTIKKPVDTLVGINAYWVHPLSKINEIGMLRVSTSVQDYL